MRVRRRNFWTGHESSAAQLLVIVKGKLVPLLFVSGDSSSAPGNEPTPGGSVQQNPGKQQEELAPTNLLPPPLTSQRILFYTLQKDWDCLHDLGLRRRSPSRRNPSS